MRPRRSPSPRAFTLGALWAVVTTALFAPACYGRNCEGDVVVFGAEPGQGFMIDDDAWESNRVDEPWLWFPRQRYYVFDLKVLGGRTPDPLAYVSATAEPTKNGGNFTVGSGNIVEFFAVGPDSVHVKNDTCSDYYLRLKLWVDPAEAGAESATQAAEGAAEEANAGDAKAAL